MIKDDFTGKLAFHDNTQILRQRVVVGRRNDESAAAFDKPSRSPSKSLSLKCFQSPYMKSQSSFYSTYSSEVLMDDFLSYSQQVFIEK